MNLSKLSARAEVARIRTNTAYKEKYQRLIAAGFNRGEARILAGCSEAHIQEAILEKGKVKNL